MAFPILGGDVRFGGKSLCYRKLIAVGSAAKAPLTTQNLCPHAIITGGAPP